MAKTIKIHEPDRFTVEDLFGMSPTTMNQVLKAMSPEHKSKLAIECEQKIIQATETGSRTGFEWAASRGISRVQSPYEAAKKYTYMYTVLAGWQSEEDLSAREQAKEQETAGYISEEAIAAFRQKGWLK